jgi:hypothetical protein
VNEDLLLEIGSWLAGPLVATGLGGVFYLIWHDPASIWIGLVSGTVGMLGVKVGEAVSRP